jgi:hypothetical protein
MGAAKVALAAATSEVAQKCTGKTGRSRVLVFFLPTGEPRYVKLDPGSPYEGTPTGTCVIEHFRAVRVPAYDGGIFRVTKNFVIGEPWP